MNEFGYAIRPIAHNSGRKAPGEKWIAADHDGTLKYGRFIYIAPYYKGTERNNPDVMLKKRHNQFLEE